MGKIRCNITVDEELHSWIKKYSEKSKTNVSQIIESQLLGFSGTISQKEQFCQYEPKISHRWIFECPYFESYLVKEINLPRVISGKLQKEFCVILYDTVQSSTTIGLLSLLKDKTLFTSSLKFLNPMGFVCSKYTFKGCLLKESDLGIISYEKEGCAQMKLRIEFEFFGVE